MMADNMAYSSESESEYWMLSSNSEDDLPRVTRAPVKRGRKPMTEKFTELIPTVQQFIQDNSAEAHNRRRDATSYSNGVSLDDIRRHVIATVPGIDSISASTIHRMMRAPRARTHSAKRYTGVVDARVPPKRNNATNVHPDFRYTCASVNYAMEMTTLFEKECVRMSCDDKNKINVGTLAVSRHFQIKRFFASSDQPNYPDHDFPFPSSKLIPSGYMEMKTKPRRSRSLTRQAVRSAPQRRTRSLPPRKRIPANFTKDPTGRLRVSWPKTGPLDVFLQASKFHSSTSHTHAAHLEKLLRPKVEDSVQPRTVVSIIADGGPDWSTKSLVNLMNYGRLWRNLNLDGLILTAYAPRHSRNNPIERSWAPLSKWLTGVTLPRFLPGETVPPSQQRGLTEEETKEKEARVFDKAIDLCSRYWYGRYIDSHPVTVYKVPCIGPTNQDHDTLKTFTSAPMSQIQNDPELRSLQEDLQFLAKHCVRRCYQMEFYKCRDSACGHCRANPVRATHFFEALQTLGGKLPTPILDSSRCKGEFMTLLRLLESPQNVQSQSDRALPSGQRKSCNKGCDYVFLSVADQLRHDKLVHPEN